MARTGTEYLEKIRTRRVRCYIGGEEVSDISAHPAFKNVLRTVAQLYDITSDPANADELTHIDEESGKRFNNIWLRPKTRDDLEARNRVHSAWAEATSGLLGRSPDHVAGWITGMACCPEVLDSYDDGFRHNVESYFKRAREEDLFISYAIVPPAGVKSADSVVSQNNVSLAKSKWATDAGLQVVEERDDGIVVSGFKVLATSAIIADEILFGNFQALAEGQEKFSATFVLPSDAPGLTLLARRPYAELATSELDDPLAFRYDETDAVVYCDNVFVPWERVFTYNRVDMARAAFSDTPAHPLGNVQAHIRLLAKKRLIIGVMKRLLESNDLLSVPAVRDTLANLAMQTAMVEALVHAETVNPEGWPNGFVAQDRQAMYATMAWTTRNFPDFMRVVRELMGSHPLQQPADVSVFDNEVTSDLYSRFTLQDKEIAIQRYKLMRLAWDLVGTEFASRHTQYEMFYNGAPHVAMNRVWHMYRWEPAEKAADEMLNNIGGYADLVENKTARNTRRGAGAR